MIRKAIIIANNTGYGASKHLSGVDKDIVNYRNYLKSDIGGAWHDDMYIGSTLFERDIKVLHNKTRAEIISSIKACAGDYSFVVFTGHGYIDSKDGLTYACVKDGVLSENDLNTGLYRQTLIMDCCRQVETTTFGITGQRFEKGGVVNLMEAQRTIINARQKFDNALSQSSLGQCRAYACEVDQTSGDNPASGGVFSTALMKVGIKFGSIDNSNGDWLPIREAVEETTRNIIADPLTKQKPTFWTYPEVMKLTHPFSLTNLKTRAW